MTTSPDKPSASAGLLWPGLDAIVSAGELHDVDIESTSTGVRSRDTSSLRTELQKSLNDFGITRVANVTGLDRIGVPVHVAIKPQGRSLSSGCGKGTTVDGSWVSAVMEAIEQSIWDSLEASDVQASAATMERFGCSVVDAATFPRVLDKPWNADLPTRWRAGVDLVSGEETWVPDELLTFRRSMSSPFLNGTNGLASGAHVLEAVLAGLLEVIERDAMALDDAAHHGVDLDARDYLSETEPDISSKFAASRVRVDIRDVTTDLGVPVVVAHVADAPGERVGYFKGAGAATNVHVALMRALTEAAQSRCVVLAGARDDIFRSERRAMISTNDSLTPHSPPATARFPVGPPPALATVRAHIEWLLRRLVESGFDHVIVVRHTTPGDLVHVVRVLVPGLEWNPTKNAPASARDRRLARVTQGRATT